MNRITKKIAVIAERLSRQRTVRQQTKYGFQLLLDLRNDVDYRFYLNDFEENTIRQYLLSIKPGMTVIDVGANIGIYTLLASNQVGVNGHVYAFEPAHRAYIKLKNNIEINNFLNITPIRSGVSDYDGETIFNVCDDDAYNSLGRSPMRKVKSTETIKIVTIDKFVQLNNIKKIDVIKVDTEGAEYLVFKGAINTLRRDKPVLFFEYNPFAGVGFDFDPIESIRALKSLNYEFYEFVDGKFKEIVDENVTTNDVIAFPVAEDTITNRP